MIFLCYFLNYLLWLNFSPKIIYFIHSFILLGQKAGWMFLSGFDLPHLLLIPSLTPVWSFRPENVLNKALFQWLYILLSRAWPRSLWRWCWGRSQSWGEGGAASKAGGVIGAVSPQLVSHQSVSIKPTLLAAKVIVNNSANTGIVVTF